MTSETLGKMAVGRGRGGARAWPRLALLLFGPLVLVAVAGYFYLTGGRYVSTDDAYVHADNTMISTDVPGRIVEVAVRENEQVKAGQNLFRLDDAPYRYALDRAQANLAMTRLNIEALRATYAQKQADLKAAQDTLDFNGRELERQKQLAARGNASQQAFDQAQHNRDAALQSVDSARQALANVLANLGGDPKLETDKHPQVLAAAAQRDQAAYDLARTIVHAPTDGIIAQVDKLQKGQYVTAGTPLFSLMGINVWVEANFKETDLTFMRPGQAVTIDVDTYPDHNFKGTVSGISPGTGSEFAILPPQNATGNWVKIVQRVPVRILLTAGDDEPPLRSGMSATVEVDTGHRRAMSAMIDSAVARAPGEK
jgi:membrane fusion protein (multidrug efflux system)